MLGRDMFGRSAEISDFALSGQGIRTEVGESMSDAIQKSESAVA